MPRKRGEDRVLGPLAEGSKWRVILIEKGQRTSHMASDRQAALRLARRLRRDIERRQRQRKVSDAIEDWAAEKVQTGRCLPDVMEHQRRRLSVFLAGHMERDLAGLTAEQAATIYSTYVAEPSAHSGRPHSVATHRFALGVAKDFGSWAVRAGLIARSPFTDVRPVGRRSAGKLQLTLDEAKRFVSSAFADYEETGEALALAALMLLMMGLRASEALLRQVRDLDDGGRLLWIPHGKTKNARRRLEVPEALRAGLLGLVQDKASDDLLFAFHKGGKYHRYRLWLIVERICKRAKVPRVCPHSLRGLHSTLAMQAGATSAAVAAALGHGDFAVTRTHYVAPGVVETAQTRRVAEVLGVELRDKMRELDEDTFRAVMALIAEKNRSGVDPKS